MAVIDDAVWISTAALLSRRRRIDPRKIVTLQHLEGYGSGMGTVKFDTHTPWIKLRVEGRALPFIVDMQSDYVDEKKLGAVRSGLEIVRGEHGWR
jgi:hypothetical protein